MLVIYPVVGVCLVALVVWYWSRITCPMKSCDGIMEKRVHCGNGEGYYRCKICGYDTYYRDRVPSDMELGKDFEELK